MEGASEDGYENIPMLQRLNNYGESGLKSPVRGEEIADDLMTKLPPDQCNLFSFLPRTNSIAIIDPTDARPTTTHNELRQFVQNFDLEQYGIGKGCRVALILPNGPDLAVCLISVISTHCAAPINATGPAHEIKSELESTKAMAVILYKGRAINEAAIQAAKMLGLGILELSPDPHHCGLFTLELIADPPEQARPEQYSINKTVAGFRTYSHPETVLLLHTSGTSGNKKCVPYSLDMILVGVGCIITSWNLTPPDKCLNMMPLFHIGGIMRNVLSPILSGSSVITCSAFDPNLFWDLIQTHRFTWYYAAPTMHRAILTAAEDLPKPLSSGSVRYIANAAGALLPVLASSLKETFYNATILTSYGMTECMPISSPPQNYALDPIGTSGRAVGPDICITDEDHTQELPLGSNGNILVRGPPCFGGYENNEGANSESFFTINGKEGWFDTGDTGCIRDGYLFIGGRSKEIINKGGETISPFEIEEQIQQHPNVQETLAFSAPHNLYQETVGVVIVTNPGMPRVDLQELHKFLATRLNRSKWPHVIVYMNDVPKNAANKILRIKLAQRFDMEELTDRMTSSACLFEAECPKKGTALTVKIPLRRVAANVGLIEDSVTLLPGVEECKVLMMGEGSAHEGSLVAFIRPSSVDTTAIQASLRENVNYYEIPSAIAAVDNFASKVTKNSNDDLVHIVDVDALMEEARILLSTQIVAPRTQVESEIEEVWRSQIGGGTDDVLSVKESFFNLGGDSLKAGQVVNAMRKKFKVNLSVSDLFSASTIEELSTKVTNIQSGTSERVKETVDLPTRLSRGNLSYSALSNLIDVENPGDDMRDNIKYKNESIELSDVDEENHVGVSLEMMSINAGVNERSKYDIECSPENNPNDSSSFFTMIIQLLPTLVFYPLRKVSVWFFISYPWVIFMNMGMSRFLSLVGAIIIARVVMSIIFPLVSIALKWIIVGKYRPGKYPLWGSMYIRWWLVEQIIIIAGKGIYQFDTPLIGNFVGTLYYTMMGAKIGKNVKISPSAHIGQFDLLDIGDNVVIDAATVRPFSLEAGYFVLLPIRIGSDCAICAKSAVVAGAELLPETCIGPLSSSHEMHDADPKYRKYCRPAFVSPPVSLMLWPGIPLIGLVLLAAYLPWIWGLNLMVNTAINEGWYSGKITTVFEAFRWWVTPQRICWYFALRVIKECVVPPLKLLVVIFIKRNFIGKFTPCNEKERLEDWNLFKYWLMAKLLPGGQLGGVLKLVGSHYDVVSNIYRLLGAKIGKRVYWPGSGVDIVEFDNFTVGDDVVFGSRSIVMTASADRSAEIVFESGVMVADRCVILPGVTLRKGSVVGSGCLAGENFEAEMGSVWVGSSGGQPVSAAPPDYSFKDKDTITPFGKAFYEGNAIGYTVITLPYVILYNCLWQMLCSVYSNCSVVLSVYLVFYVNDYNINPFEVSAWDLYYSIYCVFAPLNFLVIIVSIVVDVGGKWLVIGERTKGVYSWEFSSYCQRWQIYLTIQKIHQGYLTLIQGSEWLCMYFRSLGADIGEGVCLYPNGGDPMMTEPELVTIGDFASIDDASVIAHINTRGVFKLNPLNIGAHCVLKSNTRLLSGASMEDRSILLEHTLVLAGESVDNDTVWQGWPSDVQMSLQDYQQHISNTIDEAIYADDVSYVNSVSGGRRKLGRSKSGKHLLDVSSNENQALLQDGISSSSYNSSKKQSAKGGYSVIRDHQSTCGCVHSLLPGLCDV